MSSNTKALWTSTTLGSACEINPPKPKTESIPDNTKVMFVPMAAVDDVTGTVARPEERTLGDVRLKSYRSFVPGDVLFAKITPCMENGKAAVVPTIPNDLGFGSTEFHVLRPKPGVHPRFIWHYIRQEGFRRLAEEQMTGSVGQLRVPVAFLRDSPILLPPKELQDEIARVLDLVLASGVSAAGHLAAANRAVAQFRRAVLAAACAGRLTANWRERHERESGEGLAKGLVVSAPSSPRREWKAHVGAAELPVVPASWGMAPFGALVVNHDGRRIPVKAADRRARQGRFPYYGASGIIDHVNDYLFDGAFLLISEDGANLLARATPIAFRAEGRFWVNNHAHVVQSREGIIDTFLELVINGRDIQEYVTGSAQPKLTQAALNAIPIPVPSTAEQNEIVRRAQKLVAVAEELKQRITVASQRVSRSTQAVLAQAFRGELVREVA